MNLSNNNDIYLIFLLNISLAIFIFLINIYFVGNYMADIFDEVSEELKQDQLIKTGKNTQN